MSDLVPAVRVQLDLGYAPDGHMAVRVRRTDVRTDFGVMWLSELPVLLEALLLGDDESRTPSRPPDPRRRPDGAL